MSSVYSVQFMASHNQPAGVPLNYVVPAGSTAVIRCMDTYVGNTLAPLKIIALGSQGQVFWEESITPPGFTWSSWRGRQVIYEGFSFSLNCDDVADLTASGYLLKNP